MSDEYNIDKYYPVGSCPCVTCGGTFSHGSNDGAYGNHHIREAAKHINSACGSYHHGKMKQCSPDPFPEDHPLAIVLKILKELDRREAHYGNESPKPSLFDAYKSMGWPTIRIQT